MQNIANGLIILLTFLQSYFMVLEMFYWTKPKGLKVFGNTLEQAMASSVLAANQGLYNGFLAAGLLYGLITKNEAVSLQFKLFFSACVLIAGIYGGMTASKKILIVQAAPALLTIIFVCMAYCKN